MSEATQLAAAAAHDDPAIGLAAVVALRQLLDQLEALQVSSARAQGWTWERIARQIVILLDGAATVMLIHRDVAYVEAAGETAAALIEQARGTGKRRITASRR